MRILAAVTRPTTGNVLWNGTDITNSPASLRKVLGYLPQDFGVYPNLNAVEFLEYIAAIKGLDMKIARKRIAELIDLVNLSDAGKRPLGSYSGGMKQRVGIAQALINDPLLLIVDEPTVGLDPEERVRFRNILSDISGERIVILSTHIVSDVEASATSVVIANKGRLLTHCTPEDLLQKASGKVWEWLVPSSDLVNVRQQYIISTTVRTENGVRLRSVSDTQPHHDAKVVQPSLEDAYLYTLSLDRQVGAL